MMRIYAAPMQGFTDAPFRHFHAAIYSPAPAYFTPFLRVERGEPRGRDLRDASSPLNGNHEVTPQIIFRDTAEFSMLVQRLTDMGHKRIDLNLGCPFILQVRKGRGVAALLNRELMTEIAGLMKNYADVSFSAKIRPGFSSADEWKQTFDVLDSMPLSHLTVHPRPGRQEYSGSLDMNAFSEIESASSHPVVFNGDLRSVEDIQRVCNEHPGLSGIMIGRGLLSRPSLIEEMQSGKEMERGELLERIGRLHDGIFGYYRENLCGDTQILSKIKPFWEYLEAEIGHKAYKAIRKSTTMGKYLSAVEQIC